MTNGPLQCAVIDNSTGVTIGLAVGAVGAAIGGTWVIANLINKLRASVDEALTRLALIEKNNYTKAEAAEIALRTAVANPGMRVPDPRHPDFFIEVGRKEADTEPSLS